MPKKETRIRTIRIPVDLDNRIAELAAEKIWSVNAWIVNTLTEISKPEKLS